MNRFAPAAPTMAENAARLAIELASATDARLFAVTVEELARRHRLHANPVQNLRIIEAKLLAAQGARRRLIETLGG